VRACACRCGCDKLFFKPLDVDLFHQTMTDLEKYFEVEHFKVTGDRHYAQGAGETETKRGTDGSADVRAPLRSGTGNVVPDAGTTAAAAATATATAAGATATATAAGAAAAEATKQQVRVLPASAGGLGDSRGAPASAVVARTRALMTSERHYPFGPL